MLLVQVVRVVLEMVAAEVQVEIRPLLLATMYIQLMVAQVMGQVAVKVAQVTYLVLLEAMARTMAHHMQVVAVMAVVLEEGTQLEAVVALQEAMAVAVVVAVRKAVYKSVTTAVQAETATSGSSTSTLS